MGQLHLYQRGHSGPAHLHPGLRYFNIFGRRQDPDGAYAAVIPKWIKAMIHNEPVHINGDGETSRDFRPGDVRHSLADIAKAGTLMGYTPTHRIGQGLAEAMTWYETFFKPKA